MLRTFRGGLVIGLAVAVAIAAGAIIYERYDTRTLKRTVKRGEVLCGVNKGLPGFSIPDDKGEWTGFDVDFCRAVAAAIFNDPKKAKFVPLDRLCLSPQCGFSSTHHGNALSQEDQWRKLERVVEVAREVWGD